ncbi:putative plastid-lipid-associated protein 6, chloroplastic [Apostasia shenzhenica]|uniref:Putative plastid-lipid-associated protein 6, chloroplastic n=1 Tax=Apostasia shenzhenica TaxID=1088818 RepID=A0A2I0ADW2_9ASPA|nr:putative plastid-lipid-associated protein 6, chloroplastic [Apostasia shenzhenica]
MRCESWMNLRPNSMASLLPSLSLPFSLSSSTLRRTSFFPAAGDFSSGSSHGELNFNKAVWRRRRQGSILPAAIEQSAFLDPSSAYAKPGPDVASFKLKLLSAVSGLNRGLAANEEDLRSAESAAKELEATSGPVDLVKDLDKLQGRWKLIYSSAFSSRTLGGSRPGPPTGRFPITLGQVFQRIDVVSKDFDNIVELEFGTPWPFPLVEATATLAHKFERTGTARIKITFEKTTLEPRGNLSQLPPLEVPRLPDALRPPSNTRSGEFEVTYVDSDFRITRGDREELRVFVIS